MSFGDPRSANLNYRPIYPLQSHGVLSSGGCRFRFTTKRARFALTKASTVISGLADDICTDVIEAGDQTLLLVQLRSFEVRRKTV